MNYMKEVAQMLGVELGEEFRIDCARAEYRITERGLEFFSKVNDAWLLDCLTLNNLLCGEYEIAKLILTDEEKEYLSNIIKPFRDCIKYITKYDSPDYEYIVIEYYDNLTKEKCEMFFPCFEKDAMYKGMQLYKKYKLEELGYD